jgi:peptide/nickel transport system permease protein
MSLVDYAAAARKRAGWQGVAWQPGLWLAWAVIISRAFAAVAPGLLTHYSPIEGIAGAQRLAPQAGHWLGTDQLGRDVWTRIVYGASHSLSAALAPSRWAWWSAPAGVIAGAFAGRVESLLMRFVDVLLSIPSLLLSLTVIILLGLAPLTPPLPSASPPLPASPASRAVKWCASATRIMSKRRSAAAGRFSPCCGDTSCPTR